MSIVTVKNGDLYRQWISVLMKEQGVDSSTPQIRTEAYFNSQKGLQVPLYR